MKNKIETFEELTEKVKQLYKKETRICVEKIIEKSKTFWNDGRIIKNKSELNIIEFSIYKIKEQKGYYWILCNDNLFCEKSKDPQIIFDIIKKIKEIDDEK